MIQKFLKRFAFACLMAVGAIGQGCGQAGSGQVQEGSKGSRAAYSPLSTAQIGDVCSIISEEKLRSYFKLAEQVKFGDYRSALGLEHTCGVMAQTDGHGLQMQVRVAPKDDEEVYSTSLEVAQMLAKNCSRTGRACPLEPCTCRWWYANLHSAYTPAWLCP